MISEALRLIRVFHDTKSKDLAEKLDISPSYLSEIENGKKDPSFDILRKYAKIFSTTPSSIMFFAEDLDSIENTLFSKNVILKKTIEFLQKIEKHQK